MTYWMIHTLSGLEVVWIGHEGCAVQASSRFCTVLGSFWREGEAWDFVGFFLVAMGNPKKEWEVGS